MKQKTTRTSAQQQTRHVGTPQTGPQRAVKVNGWGLRWHAGHFRTALWLAVAAIGIICTFGQQSGALAQWFLRDAYVATRATVVKAPFWADALEPKPANSDYSDAIAGWHIELRVGDYPFTLAVALADFDPDKNSTDQKIVPDAARFAVGSVHPVWFYANNRLKQPETVALLESPPSLLISRAAFGRFPSLMEAIENSVEVLIAPAIMLSLAAIFLVLAFFGKQGGETAGAPLGRRLMPAFFAMLIAGGAYLVNNEHPLAVHDDQYVPAEIEITRGPVPSDTLTYYRGYRVLWRTWQVQARTVGGPGQSFTIDADGLDPRRAPWASRHSPDFSALQPGTKLAVWQSNMHSTTLGYLGSMNPVIQWETFLSRERWPEKYTPRDFVRDGPIATMVIAFALLLALVWLLPLGGRRMNK